MQGKIVVVSKIRYLARTTDANARVAVRVRNVRGHQIGLCSLVVCNIVKDLLGHRITVCVKIRNVVGNKGRAASAATDV